MSDVKERIRRIEEFKEKLLLYEKAKGDAPATRSWLNQNRHWVEREADEAGCSKRLTLTAPPSAGGLVTRNVNPFDFLFQRFYFQSMTPTIVDILDQTVGVLQNPLPDRLAAPEAPAVEIKRGYAFVAMPIDKDDHNLVDVLETIKAGARECGVIAERIDDDERNERITDRMLEAIRKAEFVIVDLTNERPNVFYEAGYAHGLNKIPIYIARHGTKIHFDLHDYPIIFFHNMKELREGLAKRLRATAEKRET
jgi:hypothetical protein